MPNDLHEYKELTANWRGTLRQNNHRTIIIITLFFLIYCSIGFLIDLYLASTYYPSVSLSQLIQGFFSLHLFPTVTLIMLGVSFVSLLISYLLHDKLMLLGTNYHEIIPAQMKSQAEIQLYNIVEEMKIASGLRYMPRVFIIDADYINAFASGYSEKSAMIAITRGLMQKLNRDELQAVVAHELSHIRHLDIKLTLTASLLANLTIIILDIFFYNVIFSGKNKSRNALTSIIIILRYLLPIISVFLLMYLSRTRELMADAGSVELMRTNQPLASALIKINADYSQNQNNPDYFQTAHENIRREAYLYDPTPLGIKSLTSISDLFSTHPSLEKRLKALGYTKKS